MQKNALLWRFKRERAGQQPGLDDTVHVLPRLQYGLIPTSPPLINNIQVWYRFLFWSRIWENIMPLTYHSTRKKKKSCPQVTKNKNTKHCPFPFAQTQFSYWAVFLPSLSLYTRLMSSPPLPHPHPPRFMRPLLQLGVSKPWQAFR